MSKRPLNPNAAPFNAYYKKPRYSPPPMFPDPIIGLTPPPGLTIKNAAEILQRYCGWLRNKPTDSVHYEYDEALDANGQPAYIGIVRLPSNCNARRRVIRSDQPYPEQPVAKRNAVFHAVCELYAVHEIDDELMPTPKTPSKPGPPPSAAKEMSQQQAKREITKHSPPTPRHSLPPVDPRGGPAESSYGTAGGNGRFTEEPQRYVRTQEESRNVARDILGPKQSMVEHSMLATSQFWARNPPIDTQAYGALIAITFTKRPDIDGLCRRLCLVTSRQLPFGKEVALDLLEYHNPNINLRVFPHVRLGHSAPLSMTEQQRDLAYEWSRRFVRSLTNQPIDGLLEKAPYLFLPLRKEFAKSTCAASDIAWDELNLWAAPVRDLNLRDHDSLRRSLEDAVLSSNHEFGRRHYAVRVRADLTPHSPAPRKRDVSILELAAGKNPRAPIPRLEYPDQPIVEAEHVCTAANGGWIMTLNETKPLHHVIPELLALYFLPASVVRTGTLIPSIMNALDEHLIAAECNDEVFGGKLEHLHVMRAITAPAVRLAPHNYDRLETLGDAVLHFVASVDVFRRAEPGEEGEADAGHELRTLRHLVVSNRTLAAAAANAGVVKYVRFRAPNRREYCPPGWLHSELGPPFEDGLITAELGGKIPADVVEALLGAAYLSSGKSLQAALDTIHRLEIPVRLRSVGELQTGSVMARLLGNRPHTSQGSLTVLDYEFKDAAKGISVLRLPPSAANYDHYSFLGNAVLELLVTEQLWKHLHLSPNEMTKLKHGMVNIPALSALAVATNVVEHMSVHPQAEAALAAFVAEMSTYGGLAALQDQREYWNQASDYSYLGSAFQALIGAIADDCGFDLPTLRDMYTRHIRPWMARFGPALPNGQPKNRLLAFMESKGCRQWNMTRAHDDRPGKRATDVTCHDQVVGHADGPHVHEAIAGASEIALHELLLRVDALCTCDSALRRID